MGCRMRMRLRCAAVLLAFAGLSAPVEAAHAAASTPLRPQYQPALPNNVDVSLVLAVDASGSVDDDRFELQKQGYARALLNPRVLNAIKAGNEQAIAICMMQWTGPTLHLVMVPWIVVKDEASAQTAALAIEAAPRQLFGGGTSLSGAIDFAVLMLNGSPYRPFRRVIDISGDGSNNLGRPVEQARDEAVGMGIRINGLPILSLEPDLDLYFRQNVIGGPGAFIISARDYDAFADAIMRKLVQEISQDQTGHRDVGEIAAPRPKLAAK
jgi:Protein of unknown function (DUF1194)